MMQDIMKTIIEMTVYSSAMIVAVMVLSKLFTDKLSTKIVYALWIVALIRLMLPVTLESPYRFPFPASFAAQEPAAVAQTPVADGSFAVGNTDMEYIDRPYTEIPSLNAMPQQISAPLPKAIRNLDIWSMIFAVWLTGALSYLTHNLYRIIVYNKKIKNIVSTDIRYINKLESTKKLLKIRRNIIIAESKYADIPFVYGYFAPKVLFPLGFFNAVDDEKLSYIVLHELSHVKRRDVAMNYVWMAAKAIHWFNPLIYFAYKAYKNTVEESCDEAVARLLDTQGRAQYSQSLIDTMRFSKKRYRTPLSVSFSGRESAIRKRVLKMMYPQKKSKAMQYITVLLAAIMVIVCFTTACQPAEAAQDEPQTSGPQQTQENPASKLTPIYTQNSSIDSLPETATAYNSEMTEEEALQIINELNLAEVVSIKLIQREEYFGDSIAFFMCNENENSVSYNFLESSRSIVSSENKAVDLSVPINLSDDESEAMALTYAKKIWGNENIEIISCVASSLGPDDEHLCIDVKGVIVNTNRTFNMALNGQGDLWGFTSYPTDVDMENGVSIDDAREIAIEAIREHAHIADSSCLTLISGTLSTDYAPMYVFEFEYRSDNPTSEEYDYDCFVNVMAATGKTMGVGITPITYNIDVYSLEEAGQLALDYVVKEKGLDASKLTITESWGHSIDGVIMYTFMFDYGDDYCYSLMMTATGEFWDIAGSPIEN